MSATGGMQESGLGVGQGVEVGGDGGGIDPLARVRHDLRTPVSHIQGYAEMLREQAEEEGLERFIPDLGRIEGAGRRLVELIRDELSPERLAAGGMDVRAVHAALRTPLNHALGYAELVEEEAEREGNQSLLGDLGKVRLAAREFLRLLEALVTPGLLETARVARVAVVSESRPGALALSREAVSAPGVEGVGEAGGRVLVVDDDPGNRDLLVRRLAQHGFEVEAVEDGVTALRRLRERAFDLLLLDVVMPGLGGDEVLARLKADPELGSLPVIMLSALDEMDRVVRCILAGAEDYLSKPVNTVLLRARIGACLEKSRLRRKERAYLEVIEAERQKSEVLLRNILPGPIAARLKGGETTIVDSLPDVTVLFADLVGFTALSAGMPSVDMVRILDDLFTLFDGLAEAQGLEKIKTIGDAYMVVGGLPTPRADHAQAVAEVALNMVAEVGRRYAGHPVPIRVRLGMHCGPVVAGIIGRSKFSYDLWGDTVNLASRMETLGLPGCIQVTGEVRDRLAAGYRFRSRGEVEVKGRGPMPTWFLEGRLVP